MNRRRDERTMDEREWLTTIVGRVCLNMLRARRARPAELSEAHLPDPVVTLADSVDPEQEALLADSGGRPYAVMAFVITDERIIRIDALLDLSPLMRLVSPDLSV
jgi:DNA-directed RNA polymerase specialized sigma24 family protein